MSLFLGLDVGTQGTKGLLIDPEQNQIVCRASRSYGLIEGLPPGHAEQHPDQWFEAVRTVVAELFSHPDVSSSHVRAMGVSGQQHGFVPLDEKGEVIRPAKLWCDTSTAAEARELGEAYGHSVATGFTASKILWLKRHEPDHFARLRTVLLPHDYINYRLTGETVMEAGDASGTGFFDVGSRAFSTGELEYIDPALPQMLPPIIESGESIGDLAPAAAAALGLHRGTLVATGGGDNMMSAIGSGATRPGVVVLSLGTSGTAFSYSPHAVEDPTGAIACFCDSTGGWLPLLCVMNATSVAEEIRSAFSAVGPVDLESLTELASKVEPGSGGVLFLPYLQGERVPDLPEATGSLLGLRPGLLGPGVLFRAALEGVSLNLAWGIEPLRGMGVEVDSLRVVGGGAKNALWCQILADILQVPIERLRESESAALGAALQACWTWRRYRGEDVSADEVARPFVSTEGDPVLPQASNRACYEEMLGRFKREVTGES